MTKNKQTFRFSCETLPAIDVKKNYDCPDYYSVVEKISDNGIRLETVKMSYPYTQEYVNSFLDSTDYRLNVDSSLSAPLRGNYQDISDLQRFAGMSTSEQLQVLEQVKKDYSELLNSRLLEKSSLQKNYNYDNKNIKEDNNK